MAGFLSDIWLSLSVAPQVPQVRQEKNLNSLTRLTMSALVSARGNPLLSGTVRNRSVENSQEQADMTETNLHW